MQVVNVVVSKNGVVQTNSAIIGDNQGMVTVGQYKGTNLGDAAEKVFWDECRILNNKLPVFPEQCDFEDGNLPSMDDGYYEVDEKCVCLSWAMIL